MVLVLIIRVIVAGATPTMAPGLRRPAGRPDASFGTARARRRGPGAQRALGLGGRRSRLMAVFQGSVDRCRYS